MRLFSCFSFETLSNCYLLGPAEGGDAVLVDPATFTVAALETVERNHYYVRAVLLTHCDESHMGGLQTLLRIYTEAAVYASVPRAGGIGANVVAHGDEINVGELMVSVIAMPGMGTDCVAYRIGSILFTGTAFTAGETGTVRNPYAKGLLLRDIRERILTLPEETVLLPFCGPPSTIAVERITTPTDPPPELAGVREIVPEDEL